MLNTQEGLDVAGEEAKDLCVRDLEPEYAELVGGVIAQVIIN